MFGAVKNNPKSLEMYTESSKSHLMHLDAVTGFCVKYFCSIHLNMYVYFWRTVYKLMAKSPTGLDKMYVLLIRSLVVS